MEMPPPHNIKQLRGLQGRLQSIRWFISQLGNKAQPFNKNLHKGATCIWNEKCQKNLDQIKDYLAKPPILMPPIQGKPLILYIYATKNSFGALLAQQDDMGKERAIYYISHTLVTYKLKYTIIEKLVQWQCLRLKNSDITCSHIQCSLLQRLILYLPPK